LSYQEMFAMLDRAGLPRKELTLAWDFVTASDTRIQANLLQMRDAALARIDADDLGFTITKVSEQPPDQPLVLRIVEGTFAVPSFLIDGTDPSLGMQQTDSGLPMDTGRNYKANLLLIVPACAKTATLPLRAVVYGHGLLGAADEIESSLHRTIANQL